jgi:dolichol-phosphate mannosyltransferase
MLSLLVTTKNEVGNISDTIHRLGKAMEGTGKQYEVLVLDSDSTDGTQYLVEKLEREYPIRLINCNGLDLAQSFVKGVMLSKGEYLLMTDGDGQHNLEGIPTMLSYMMDADIVVDGAHPDGWRRIPSMMARCLTKLAIPKLRDMDYPTANFFIVKREVAEAIDWNPTGFKPLMEVLVKGKYKKLVFISTQFHKRNYGNSKFGVDVVIKHIVHLNRLRGYNG